MVQLFKTQCTLAFAAGIWASMVVVALEAGWCVVSFASTRSLIARRERMRTIEREKANRREERRGMQECSRERNVVFAVRFDTHMPLYIIVSVETAVI